MNILRRYAIPVIALPVLCAAAAAIMLYRLGWYDISLITRPADSGYIFTEGENAPAEDADADEGDAFAQETGNLSGVFDAENLDSPVQTEAAQAGSSSPAETKPPLPPSVTVAELKKAGYVWTDTDYSAATHRLGLVTGGIPLTKLFSVRDGRPALRTYMGYILYDDGKHISALGLNGIVSVAGIEKLTPAYVRDSDGRPLFTYKDKYYHLVDNSNEMIQVRYNPLYAPPLKYDSPREYSIGSAVLSRYYVETVHQRKIDADGNDVTVEVDQKLSGAVKEGKDITDAAVYAKLNIPEYTLQYRDCILWGYLGARGGVAIAAQYYFASEFNENGIAVVGDANGKLKLINSWGGTVADPSGTVLYLDERNRRPATEAYYLPETFGIESLGMFTFDHGLMRIRRCLYDYKEEWELIRERDILIQPDGTEFKIPQDYKLRGYSSGVMLLEKNGYYGFFDYTGKWIAQPIYTYAQPFIEGLAVIGFTSGKRCMIDNKGNIVLPFIYDHISNASSGVITAYSSDGWSIFNKMSR